MRGQICSLCASPGPREFGRWADFTVLQCRRCGFRFIDTEASDYPTDAQYVYDELDDLRINPKQPHLRRRARDILRFKQPPGGALDIGCGKGEMPLLLAQIGFRCPGIDMKEWLIRYLQQHYPSVTWRRAMANELEDGGERFDVITLYHVLEHVPGPVAYLKKIKRLANPGALIVIEVPNVGGLEARLKDRRWHYYKVDHVNYFRPSDLRRTAEQAGLQVLGFKGYQHFSYPQEVLWKDFVKGTLACLGFKDVISVFARV